MPGMAKWPGEGPALPEQHNLLAVTSCLGTHQPPCPGSAGRTAGGMGHGLPSPSEQPAGLGLLLSPRLRSLGTPPAAPPGCGPCPHRALPPACGWIPALHPRPSARDQASRASGPTAHSAQAWLADPGRWRETWAQQALQLGPPGSTSRGGVVPWRSLGGCISVQAPGTAAWQHTSPLSYLCGITDALSPPLWVAKPGWLLPGEAAGLPLTPARPWAVGGGAAPALRACLPWGCCRAAPL